MFLTGVTTTIGPRATVKFFVKPRNQRGAFCFLLGLLLVLMKWAVVGMIIECYGFFALFAGFFPTVLLFLQRVPVLGTMLRFPGLNQFVKKIVKKGQRLPVWSSSRSQRYSILLVERKNEKKGKEKFVRARARFFNAGTRRFRFRDVLHLQQLSNNNNSLGTFCFATRILYLYLYTKIIINLWCSASSSAIATCTARFSFFFVLRLRLLRLRLSRQRRRLFYTIQSVGSSSRPVLFLF